MNLINVTANFAQTQTLVLADGSSFDLTLLYKPRQQGWFISNLTYGAFSVNGIRVTLFPNILNQYRNQIPFGLACFAEANREPMLQDDFVTLNANLYLLTSQEVQTVADLLSGKVQP